MPNHQITAFRATFDSDCQAILAPECKGWIEEGEDAAYVDDEAACSDCVSWAREQSEDARQSWAERMAAKSRKKPVSHQRIIGPARTGIVSCLGLRLR